MDQTSAVTISPPLRGPGWVAFNGCCDELNSHRGTILAINGRLRVFERFAIDFVQLDSSNRLFSGDASALSSYGYFGTSVYSVAEGTVSKVVDRAPEQTPGKVAPGLTLATAGGNNVVVDIAVADLRYMPTCSETAFPSRSGIGYGLATCLAASATAVIPTHPIFISRLWTINRIPSHLLSLISQVREW